jgi:lipopolysaccharide/colanic/teichoic acid biosynthesis glycosyltransferase
MIVFRNDSTMWRDLAGMDQESTALLDSLREVVTSLPQIQIAPESRTVEELPAAVPSPAKTRIRPVSGRRPSVFQQRLAAGQALVESEGNYSTDYRKAKRAIDFAGALFVLLLLSPVLITVYLILLITTHGKPIYRQVRLGRQGRPFTMYKFRTMRPDADGRLAEVKNEKDGPIFKNRRDPRVTRLGRILRVTSLDETPQLFNVLLGQMSLVGPRPPIGKEVAQYEPWQRRRLSVMPGLTCLWQVSGRSEIGFQDWVRMDLWYIRHQNLWTDLWLLVKTPWSVLTGRGAY